MISFFPLCENYLTLFFGNGLISRINSNNYLGKQLKASTEAIVERHICLHTAKSIEVKINIKSLNGDASRRLDAAQFVQGFVPTEYSLFEEAFCVDVA